MPVIGGQILYGLMFTQRFSRPAPWLAERNLAKIILNV